MMDVKRGARRYRVALTAAEVAGLIARETGARRKERSMIPPRRPVLSDARMSREAGCCTPWPSRFRDDTASNDADTCTRGHDGRRLQAGGGRLEGGVYVEVGSSRRGDRGSDEPGCRPG